MQFAHTVYLCIYSDSYDKEGLLPATSRGIQFRLVGIQIRPVVFKSVSWCSNSSRGIQIRLVVFKFVSWYSSSSRGIQIRLLVFKFVFVVFKFVWRVRLTALDCLVGNCC